MCIMVVPGKEMRFSHREKMSKKKIGHLFPILSSFQCKADQCKVFVLRGQISSSGLWPAIKWQITQAVHLLISAYQANLKNNELLQNLFFNLLGMQTFLLDLIFTWRSKTFPAGVELSKWDCRSAGSSWLVWGCGEEPQDRIFSGLSLTHRCLQADPLGTCISSSAAVA